MCFRADAVTDLDEGAAPSDPTGGPAEGPSGAGTGPGTEAGPASSAAEKEAEDPSVFLRGEGEAADGYACRIFERVFGHDIERVLRMEVSLYEIASAFYSLCSLVLANLVMWASSSEIALGDVAIILECCVG